MPRPSPPPFARVRLRVTVLVALVALACSNKLDQAAKARIFSPEEPPSDLQRAAETLPIDKLVTDGAVWSRVWQMDRLEVTHRIGPHKAHASVHFRWTRAGRTVELTEDQSFETSADGQFHATLTNDQDSGFEYVWAGGKAYARGRYGSFHMRRTDRAQQDAVREQATGALATVFRLLRRRAHASAAGSHEAAGRPAERFLLSLGAPWGPEEPHDATRAVYGQSRESGKEGLHPGPDEDTARRLELDALEEPQQLSGEIVVDPSGVILTCVVRAQFTVPEPTSGGATLELDANYNLLPQSTLTITPPKDVVTVKLPHAVNDPLWFTRSSATAKEDEEEDKDSRVEERTDDEGPSPARQAPSKVPPPADKLPAPHRSSSNH